MSVTRILLLAVVGFILYKMITNEMRKRADKSKQPGTAAKRQKAPAGDLVKDPVCGVYVDAGSSISVRDGEEKHYFCSYECRDSFLHQRSTKSVKSETGQPESNENEKEKNGKDA